MAKKFVRGITDVKTINNQDFDTNNVNDLLSDGQYNYIHRKKGKTEEYHNLTDNIKTISSDNTELLSVTNNNKTNNTATLSPKHDAQKEQLLESTRDTITINHGTNGTAEKTTVDTNPQKVLEHENLISSSQYVTIEHVEDSNTSEIKTDELNNTINELNSKITTVEGKIPTDIGTVNLVKDTGTAFVMGYGITNTTWNETKKQSILDFSAPGVDLAKSDEIMPQGDKFFDFKPIKGTTYTQSIMIDTDATFNPNGKMVFSWFADDQHNLQKAYIKKVGAYSYQVWSTYTWNLENTPLRAFDLSYLHNVLLFRTTGTYLAFYKPKLTTGTLPSDWSPAQEDTQEQFNSLNSSLAQKQDVLTAGDGITIQGQTISYSGTSSTIQRLDKPTDSFIAIKHVVTSGQKKLTTFVFQCHEAESVLSADLIQQLEGNFPTNRTISNGAVSITNDGTTMKLINSAASENVSQQGTFTFHKWDSAGGGGGELPPAS